MPALFQVKGVDHLVLRVSDLDRARNFYEEVLGCSLERSLPELGLYQFRAGAQLIDLVTLDSPLGGTTEVKPAHRNQDHFCLILEPFNEEVLRRYFNDLNVACSETRERYGAGGFGPSFYITDPDGNVVELKG